MAVVRVFPFFQSGDGTFDGDGDSGDSVFFGCDTNSCQATTAATEQNDPQSNLNHNGHQN